MKILAICRAVVLVACLALAPLLASGPARAFDTSTTDEVDLTSVRAKLKIGNYTDAIAELRDLAKDHQEADVYNLMGFALRKIGDYASALTYYNKALELQPDHKAAREYLGELYVETGNLTKAREQLGALTKLCPNGCEEREDLEKALDASGRRTSPYTGRTAPD